MIAWLVRVALDVRVASYLGAAMAGEPDFGECASRIAWRESRHTLIGEHPRDAWMGRTLGDGWGTRGAHGNVARFAIAYLPSWMAFTPRWFDIPLVSAIATTRRATSRRCAEVRGCVVWRRCDR